MFRDSGHTIAALTDASAPQPLPNDVNVKDSGQQCAPTVREGEVQVEPADCGEQGDKPPLIPNPSIKVTPPVDGKDGGSSEVKSYAGCFQNKYHLPPGAAHEYAATLGMVVDADCELGSEAAGKRPNDDAYDYDEYDFYDQESGEAAGEGPDNAAGDYVAYDDYDCDDDLDSLSDGYELEIDVFDFSDSECGEETSPLNTSSHTEGNRTQNIAISGPAVGEHAGRSGPGTDPPAADNQPSQAAPDPPRRQSPKRAGLTGGFVARVMFFLMLFGGVMME